MRQRPVVHLAALLLLRLVNGPFAHAQEGPLQEFDHYGRLAPSDRKAPGLDIVKNDAVM
jgi:hypothetical protein